MNAPGEYTEGRPGNKRTTDDAPDHVSQQTTDLDGQSQVVNAPSSRLCSQAGQTEQYSRRGSKVAIPRARPKPDLEDPGGQRVQRTNQACTACRRRKVKCGGEKPQCKQCQTNNVHCEYTEGKRDRTKRVAERIDQIEDLLRRLADNPEIGEPDKAAIEQVLLDDEAQSDKRAIQRFGGESLTASSRDPWSSAGSPADNKRRRISHTSPPMEELLHSSGGENRVTAAVGSAGSVDVDMEDYDRDEETRATGMRGKPAVSTWLHSVVHVIPGEDQRASLPYGRPGDAPDDTDNRVASSKARHIGVHEEEPPNVASYHQDSHEVVKDLEDRLFMPPRQTAERLVEIYMSTVHRAFVLIENADSLLNAIDQYYIDTRDGGFGSLPWQTQAIANLIFAIGTKHCDLVGAAVGWPDLDHLDFYNRARLLSMRGRDFVAHPSMAQVQILGLTSLYFMATGQVNRSWRFSAMAINDATCLGLHLRNQAHSTSLQFKQKRLRTWWALFSIDQIVCVMTGRPTAIPMKHCSAPYPAPYSQEMLMSPSGQAYLEQWDTEEGDKGKETPLPQRMGLEPAYLRLKVRLTVIEHGIMDNIYSAAIASDSWKDIQILILKKESELEFWIQTLPPGLRFELEDPRSLFSPENEPLLREKLSLALSYYSAKCVLYRPCVCRIDGRINAQSQLSKHFNSEKARECVRSAKTMIALLPDPPDPAWLYQNGPWWSVVEDILRPATICALEMAHELVHLSPQSRCEENEHLMSLIEKIMRWLYEMGRSDIQAQAAHGKLVARWKALAKKTRTRLSDGKLPAIPEYARTDYGSPAVSRSFDPATYGAASGSNQFATGDNFGYTQSSQVNEQPFAPFAPYTSAGHDLETGMGQTTGAAGNSWDYSPQTIMQTQGHQMQEPHIQYQPSLMGQNAQTQGAQASDWMPFPFPQHTGYYGGTDLQTTAFDEVSPFQTLSQDEFGIPAASMGMPAQTYTGYANYTQDAGPVDGSQFAQVDEERLPGDGHDHLPSTYNG